MSKISTPGLRAHWKLIQQTLPVSITTHSAPEPVERRGLNISQQQRLARGRIGAKTGGLVPMYTVVRKRRRVP